MGYNEPDTEVAIRPDDTRLTEAIAEELARETRGRIRNLIAGADAVTRGRNQPRSLEVILNEDEVWALTMLAAEKQLPLSTLIRSILLKEIGPR